MNMAPLLENIFLFVWLYVFFKIKINKLNNYLQYEIKFRARVNIVVT